MPRWAAVSLPRLCGRNGGACDLRRIGAGDGALSGQADRVSEGADAAALGGAELYRRVPVVGGLVRVQCRVGAVGGHAGDLGVRGDSFWRGGGGDWLEAAEWIRQGKPSALGAISGAVAGLVAITPAAGFVTPMSALWIGLIAGAFCYFMVVKVKSWFGYDDSLDAFGVHGAGGTLGAIADRHLCQQRDQSDLWSGEGRPGCLKGTGGSCSTRLVGVAIAWSHFDCGYADDSVRRG